MTLKSSDPFLGIRRIPDEPRKFRALVPLFILQGGKIRLMSIVLHSMTIKRDLNTVQSVVDVADRIF